MKTQTCKKQWCGMVGRIMTLKKSTSWSLGSGKILPNMAKENYGSRWNLGCYSADFQIMRKSRLLEQIRYNHSSPCDVEQGGRRGGWREGGRRETWPNRLTVKLEGESPEPRNMGIFQKLEGAKKWIIPKASRKERSSVNTLIWPQ